MDVSPALDRVRLAHDFLSVADTLALIDRCGSLYVGAGSVLFSGTRIIARGGSVHVGEAVEIGEEGGFTVKADTLDICIKIGDGARLLGGGSLVLNNYLGAGAQVVGPIRLQQCHLHDCKTYREPEPDWRVAVLKGSGVARGLTVPQGHLIQAFGLFSDAPMRRQSKLHPVHKA